MGVGGSEGIETDDSMGMQCEAISFMKSNLGESRQYTEKLNFTDGLWKTDPRVKHPSA